MNDISTSTKNQVFYRQVMYPTLIRNIAFSFSLYFTFDLLYSAESIWGLRRFASFVKPVKIEFATLKDLTLSCGALESILATCYSNP